MVRGLEIPAIPRVVIVLWRGGGGGGGMVDEGEAADVEGLSQLGQMGLVNGKVVAMRWWWMYGGRMSSKLYHYNSRVFYIIGDIRLCLLFHSAYHFVPNKRMVSS